MDPSVIAECLDLFGVTQGVTLDELTRNLQQAVVMPLEGEDPATFGVVEKPSILASIEIEAASYAPA